jgi:hypothetical protein
VVDRRVAEFHRGEYAAAKKDLEQNASDPRARAFLALTQAATGHRDAGISELEHQFVGNAITTCAG